MNQNPQYPYGSNPNDPRADPYNAYPPPLPGSGSNPGFYPPSDPAEEATLPSSGSNPDFNPYTSTPPPPPPPPKRSRLFSARVLFLIGLALLIILAGISFGIIVPYQNAQTSNAHATATAQARFNATAQANTLATAVSGAATANANATATVTASQYPFSDKLVLNDPMYDNSHGSGWAEGSGSTGGNCQFTQGAYHVSETQSGYYYNCLATSSDYSNFTYEVKMTIIKGDYGGIIFRAQAATGKLYYLLIAQDGSYFLFLIQNGNIQALRTGTIPSSIGFYPGLNQANTIGVVARGSTFDFYMNGQHFVSVTDSTYSEGAIGVTVDALNHPTEVAFSDAKVWML